MNKDFNKELDTILFHKLEKEFKEYKNSVLQLSAQEVYESAYEITYKQDIMFCFEGENDCNLSNDEMKMLIKKDKPLEFLYQEWLGSDLSIMPDLRDCIKNTAQHEAEIQKAEKQKASREER